MKKIIKITESDIINITEQITSKESKINNGDVVKFKENIKLPNIYDKEISIVRNVEYTVKTNGKEGYEGWVILVGMYKDGVNHMSKCSLSFSPSEFKKLKEKMVFVSKKEDGLEFGTVNYSDLKNTWSPDAILRTKRGKNIYTFEKGQYVKRDKEPSTRTSYNWGYKSKEVFYLTDEEAEQINGMMSQVLDLEGQAKEIRKEIDTIIGNNRKYVK